MFNPQRLPDEALQNRETISRLLQLGITGPRRPVDALVERLSAADGAAYFKQMLARAPIKNLGDPEVALVHGRCDEVALDRLKEASKRLLQDAINDTDRLAGLAGYFFSVAAALVHQDRNITSRSTQELHEVLLELASVSPGAWARFLGAAAIKARDAQTPKKA
jgi:hypothetical protein